MIQLQSIRLREGIMPMRKPETLQGAKYLKELSSAPFFQDLSHRRRPAEDFRPYEFCEGFPKLPVNGYEKPGHRPA